MWNRLSLPLLVFPMISALSCARILLLYLLSKLKKETEKRKEGKERKKTNGA
jgi:hypothetical protein